MIDNSIYIDVLNLYIKILNDKCKVPLSSTANLGHVDSFFFFFLKWGHVDSKFTFFKMDFSVENLFI